MAATLESLNPTLERVYAPKQVVEQLYQDTPFLDKIKKTNKYTVGEEARVVLHDGRNGGFTNLPEGGGTLNEAGQQGYHKAKFGYKHHHIQVAIQGEAIDGTAGDANAIVDATTSEIDGAIEDASRQLTRQLYQDGSALIAKCRTSATNNLDLDTTSGRIAIERGWLFKDQPVEVGTKASQASVAGPTKITAVDDENWAVTLASGNVTSEDATIYISQAKGRSGEVSRELQGMRKIVSIEELGGLSSSTSPVWKSNVNTENIPLTIPALLSAERTIKQKRGKKSTFMVTGLKQEQRFYEQLQQQVTFNSDSGLTAGNSETATWKGMEIFADPDCPDEDLYMGHWDHLFMVALNDGYWQNKITGGNILVWSQGTDAFVGKYTYRGDLATNRRNDLYRFTNLK